MQDTVTKLSVYSQSEPNELENYEEESSSPSLITSNAERQENDNEDQKELKGLIKLVTSL